MKHIFAALLTLIFLPSQASEVEIINVNATQTGITWRFDVTLRHADTGWDHYADGWEVTLTDGTRLGFRELLHPHVNEQPFTRSLSSVEIPAGVTSILVRAKDNLDGWSTGVFRVDLP